MKLNNKTAKKLKKDFPIFENNKGLVYLDNAATSQKPKQVIKAIRNFYEKTNANIHRGVYNLSEKSTEEYNKARKIISDFINANENEIIFTRSATEALNLLSYTLPSIIKKGKDEIVLTEMEHHSNLVPWQQLARRNNLKLRFIKIKSNFTLDMKDAKKKITNKTAILSIVHVSNSLGTINPVKQLVKIGKKKDAIIIIDAAQSVPHLKVDVKNLNCDFLAFSSHKMFGPLGTGVLYGKKELLDKLSPFNFGGDMIKRVSYKDAEWNDLPMKFEAGTQNISGVIGLAEAIKYIKKIGIKNIGSWEKKLLKYALQEIKKIPGIKVYNPGFDKSAGILSFNLEGVHTHDVATLFDGDGIAIRGGHHCNMPLMKKLEISGTCRASFYLYNTLEDVDRFIKSLKKIKEKFR